MKNIDWLRIAILFTMAAIVLSLILRFDDFRTKRADIAYEVKKQEENQWQPQDTPLIDNLTNNSATNPQIAERTQQNLESDNSTSYSEFDTSVPTRTASRSTNKQPVAKQLTNSNEITVRTDVVEAKINTIGGDVVGLRLLQHNERRGFESPVQLLQNSAGNVFVAQSGVINIDKKGRPHYSTAQSNYQLEGDTVEVRLYAVIDDISVVKSYTFYKGRYDIGLSYSITNGSTAPFDADLTVQFRRHDYIPRVGDESMGMAPFIGPAITSNEKRYNRFEFEDLNKKPHHEEVDSGWVAMVQRYFTSAWIPASDSPIRYSLRKSNSADSLYLFGYQQRGATVASGAETTLNTTLYVGPKDQYVLAKLASNLDLTVDYSWLWWAAQPLFDLLSFFYTGQLHAFGEVYNIFGGFANWGAAIILLTLLVKLVFFRLSATSYKSMAKMRKLQPKMAVLKERYGSDRQKMSQETMKLYKKEKVNPLGGCLPMLIQMPIFLALYWVLLESVELRHAPFIGWITDLSSRDPWFILPILMGASMFVQFQLNPAPTDPLQAKVMKFMPVFMTLIFLFMPSGLVLYWTVNNMLSIAQQWYITKKMGA